jgi:hypothetical protein
MDMEKQMGLAFDLSDHTFDQVQPHRSHTVPALVHSPPASLHGTSTPCLHSRRRIRALVSLCRACPVGVLPAGQA